MRISFKGKFLISTSTLIDPIFSKTVVLVLEHDLEGAFGLILNREEPFTLFDLIDNLSTSAKDVSVFNGGPLQSDILFVMHNQSKFLEDPKLQTIDSGIYWGSNYKMLYSLLDSSHSFQVFHGYAGWGSGQLEKELQSNSWIVANLDSQKLFQKRARQDSEMFWRNTLAKQGGIFSYFAKNVQDPFLN